MEHDTGRTPILGKWDFIFLLGESGGGKGTLVRNIKKYLFPDVHAESMGDIFRKRAQSDPEIKRLTEEGNLIGDEVVHQIFSDFVHNNYGGIIDGYPRNRSQALEAVKLMKKIGWRVLVIDINCKMETILERLFSRGRADDSLEIMYKRNLTHKTLHPAVMEEIRHRHDVFDIIDLDGNKGPDMVFSELLISLLRYVDPLDLYDKAPKTVTFKVSSEETTIDAAINRILTSILLDIQRNV